MVVFFFDSKTLKYITTQAARWGADQELEACCDYISKWFVNPVYRLNELRAVRRPKPPSLNKQAIAVLEASLRNGYIKANDGIIILRALESLPDTQD